MPKPKIALVVNQKEDIEAYLKHLCSYDAEIRVTASFKELELLLSSESYNGIIVDLKIKLSVAREQKMLAYDLLEHYPVLQSRIPADSDRMQVMPFGKSQWDVSLESFLTEECPNFEARRIRSAIRRRIHFNNKQPSSILDVFYAFFWSRTWRTALSSSVRAWTNSSSIQ